MTIKIKIRTISPVSLDIIKYKAIQTLTNALIYVTVYMVLRYVLETQDMEWPGGLMFIIMWFFVDFAIQSGATEYYILPEFESQVRQILEKEGLKLKSQDAHRLLYHKPRRFGRNDFVAITQKETYFTVKGSTDFSPKLEPLISDDMLYGKRKRPIFSRLNQPK